MLPLNEYPIDIQNITPKPTPSARCVVLREPATVTSVLAAPPFSPAEMAALRALQPAISACLDAGIAFTTSRQSLRGLLAEAALHYGEGLRDGFPAPAAASADP